MRSRIGGVLAALAGATVVVSVAGFLTWGCVKSDSDSSSSDTKSETIEDATVPHTIEIDSGDLAGVALDVPAGALPEGTTVSLGAGSAPDEFGDATGGDNVAASKVVELKMTAEDGSAVVASSTLELAIPYEEEGIALASVETVVANLVALLKDYADKLTFWRYGAFTIDETAKIVTLATKVGGLYQLAFVAAGPVPGFEGATSGSGVDLAAIKCPSGTSSFYDKAKDNEAFQGYYDGIYTCVCESSAQTVANCDEAFAELMKGSLCTQDGSMDSLTDDQITEIFAGAKKQIPKDCDFTKQGTTSVDADDDADDDSTGAPDTDDDDAADDDDEDSGDANLACYTEAGDICVAYVGSFYADLASSYSTSCTSGGGTWHTDGCPTAGQVGTCTEVSTTTGANQLDYVFYSNVETAENTCVESQGNWVPAE